MAKGVEVMKKVVRVKVYGYCRISRKEQSIDRQIRNIKAKYPDAIIIQEAYTGTKIEGRKEFEKLIKQAKKDAAEGIRVIIVFDSVSRMSRDAAAGFAVYQDFYSSGVELEFLKEPHIDTSTYREAAEKQISIAATGDDAADELIKCITDGINRYIMKLAERQIQIAFQQSEKEVSDLHQRTVEGMETARLAGKQIGGLPGVKRKSKKADPAKEVIKKHSKDFEGTLTDNEVMKLTGLARNTYYKYKKELKEGE